MDSVRPRAMPLGAAHDAQNSRATLRRRNRPWRPVRANHQVHEGMDTGADTRLLPAQRLDRRVNALIAPRTRARDGRTIVTGDVITLAQCQLLHVVVSLAQTA